jgi:plastocyanin
MVLGLPSHDIHIMRLNSLAAIAVFASVLSACGERGMSPTSPSLLSSRASDDAPRPATRLAPRRVDEDGDGYEDPEPYPIPDPGMYPPPNPEQVPPPDGMPMPGPEGIPAPQVQLTINVVGTFGTGAFAPNPLQAAVGNTIVWTNNDLVPHDIVLDNGTPVGNIAPGQSSIPMPLATESVSYRCTIHPSMTGQIVPIPALPTGEPLPPDQSQTPAPDPSGSPAPPSNPYGDGYDDGYDDDYY